MAKCDHGMPSAASCIDCMYEGELPPLPKPAKPTVEARFEAQYEGYCSPCNLPIQIGQPIARLSDNTYVHQGSCEP